MKALRVIASLATAIVALGLLCNLAYKLQVVPRTIDNSKEINARFKEAAGFVQERISQTGHVPSVKEFEAWAARFSKRLPSIHYIRLELPPYANEFTMKNGQAPKDGYVLSYWRGEWEETFVSWTKRSSVETDPAAFFMFGSAIAEAAVSCALAFCFLGIAIKLWPRREHAA